MKLPKIMTAPIEIEFIGIKGFFHVLYCILKVGIKRANINFVALLDKSGNAGIVKKHTFYVIPIYKLKKSKRGDT
jgi:hypothetical protein